MLVDLSKSEQEILESIRNSEDFKSQKFWESHNLLIGKKISLVRAAKIFILDNYKKIQDYSDLRMDLKCANHEGTTRFGKKREEGYKERIGIRSEILLRILKEMDEKKVEILTFDKAVYDWTDGDFSVVFNGVDYNWIDDGSVISIASYIESSLKKDSENQ